MYEVFVVNLVSKDKIYPLHVYQTHTAPRTIAYFQMIDISIVYIVINLQNTHQE